MSPPESGDFDGVVAVHAGLCRSPDTEATGDALHPGRLGPPAHWTPTLEPIAPYAAVDPSGLGLSGYDSFHDIPDARIDRAVCHVVDVEDPVHFRVLADRLLAGADVGRLGRRIRERIEAHCESLAAHGMLQCRGEFSARGHRFLQPRFRDWRRAPDKTRELDHVPDSELMLCLFRAVVAEEGIDCEGAMNDGLHAIGFVRLTGDARERLHSPLQELLDDGMLWETNGRLHLGDNAFRRPKNR